MKKIFVAVLIGFSFVAYANDVTKITSKTYVDTEIAKKQDAVPAVNANTVMTHTDTAGTVGQKAIYDATGSYATQQDALVTAGTADAAIQMAIEGEFVCAGWPDGVEHTYDNCWLWRIQEPVNQSRNLFDPSQLLRASGWTENNGVYTGTANNMFIATHEEYGGGLFSRGIFKPNTQYTLSYTMSAPENGGGSRGRLYIVYTDGTALSPKEEDMVSAGETKHVVLTSTAGKTVWGVQFTYGDKGTTSLSNIQIEEGTTATPYQPYGQNTFLPENL